MRHHTPCACACHALSLMAMMKFCLREYCVQSVLRRLCTRSHPALVQRWNTHVRQPHILHHVRLHHDPTRVLHQAAAAFATLRHAGLGAARLSMQPELPNRGTCVGAAGGGLLFGGGGGGGLGGLGPRLSHNAAPPAS